MPNSLYINGVFEEVLTPIVMAQSADPNTVCYLQPYSSERIKLLAENPPSPSQPIRLYLSLTDSLSLVSYRALIVGWQDKRELKESDLEEMNKIILERQSNEELIFLSGGDDQIAVNLLSIVKLEKLFEPTSVSSFIKASDGNPLKRRTRSGGWSYVYEQPEWVGMQAQTFINEQLESELKERIEASTKSSAEARRARLAAAPKHPETIDNTGHLAGISQKC